MSFQLVRASDTDIAVWNVENGHIFVFQIPEGGSALIPGPTRDAPDAERDAASLKDEALRFATAEARSRSLLVEG